MRQAQPRGAAGTQQKRKSKVVDRDGNDPADLDEGAAAGAATAEDDDAIAAFFQEVKQEVRSAHVIRKVSGYQGLEVIRLGPDFVDDDYYECTPVPLWQKAQPILNYDKFLDRTEDEIITITPIKPQTFSALFQFYRDRTPALNWDPHLTDLEEDCFYQDLIHLPSKKFTHSLPKETKKEKVPKKRVKVFKPSGDYIIKTRLTIDLTETPTTILFELKGVTVLESDPKAAEIKVKNERYAEMVKDHIVSDTYANDYAQSFEDYSLSKYTDYKINGCHDAGTQVHTYSIVDEYIKVAEDDAKKKIFEQDEAAARALAEKARLDIPQGGWKDSDSEDSDEERAGADILDFRTDISKYKDDEEDNHRALILDEASDDDVPVSDDEEEECEIRQSLDLIYKNKALMDSKKPPRIYPDISFSLIAMERIICMDSQQLRQADMRGLIEPEPIKSNAITHKSDDEDETKAGDVELDEDAMVSLLIQQHRLQEQLEQEGGVDEGVPTIIIPDQGDDRKEGDDEDDDLLQEANAAEEAERKRQEQIKMEQEAAEKAAAAATVATQAVDQEPDDKDEFDQAVDDLMIVAKPGEEIVEIFAPGHSAADIGHQHSEPVGGTSAAVPTTTEGLSSMADTAMDSVSKHEEPTPPTVTESRGGTQTATPEVKTIVPPSHSRPATGVASSTPSAMVSGAGFTGTELRCSWTQIDEKFDEERVDGNEAQAKDVIDDQPIDLPQFNPDGGLSDEEVTTWAQSSNKGKKKDFTLDMKLMDELDEIEASASPASPSEEIKVPVKPVAAVEDKDKKKPEDDDEFDDVSSDETHHENSELSDHVELSEDASTDSEASGRRTTIFGAGQKRVTESGKQIYMDWGKEVLDSEMGPIAPGPHLRQYWTFKCRETAGLEVTEIKLHPLNENIIAATYGSVRFGDHEREGLLCIWNAKNNRSPERIYKLRAPGTSLAFSELTPFVLAVGMLDGNVVLFDLREDDAVILGSTCDQKMQYGHVGPIWQVYFLITVDPSNEDVVEESLLTLGDDGLLKKWTITKGLESNLIMKVGRSTLQVPGRREKRSESLITTLSIAYTVCFFPNNSDLFLLGTEEGFIHKCSTAYKESYVSTYVGHTGPVYRVAFSNFDDTVFFSCGGDWTVKMWKLEHPMPLLSLQTGHRTIFDVTCSMFSSTVFVCATEYHVEVWDLSVNTLEPIVHYKPAFALGQRKVAFIGLLNSVIIGDDEGSLTIYGLRNFAKPPPTREAKRELLLESLLPGYKRKKEAEEAERARRREMERGSHSLP